MKYRPLCNHAGAKAQPMIKIYSGNDPLSQPYNAAVEAVADEVDGLDEAGDAAPPRAPKNEAASKKFSRRPVATWQGVLIAYEIMQWFLEVQRSGLIRPEVTWAPEENLTAAMQAWNRVANG